MSDLNLCQFIGRVGKDVEMKYLQSGDAVANFSIACGWKTKNNEGTEWVNISAFGKLGEVCGKYLKKGSQVYVQGRMKTDKWTDSSGATKYSTKIQADSVQFLGSKGEINEVDQPAQGSDDSDSIPF